MKKSVVVAVLLAVFPEVAPAQAASSDDPLIGIWGSETTFGPALHGELTVRRDGSEWSASLTSAVALFRSVRDSVRFGFSGGLGQFRGALSGDGRTIDGFWIQPKGLVNGYPFASPVTLRLAGRGVWRGPVRPLPDRYSFYLAVTRSATGALVGVFRNPELNSYPRVAQYRVTRAGDSVIFSAGSDTSRPVIRIAGTLHDGRLALRWTPLDRVLVLTPHSDSQAVGLFARVPRGVTHRYTVPVAEGDGWRTDRASAVGMDEAALAALVQRIADTVSTLPRAPLAAKTFASVLLGAAMMRGVRIAPESRLAPLLVTEAPFANPDPRKDRITLAHLMTHSSGLACDDNDDASPGNEGTMLTQERQPDYWKYTMDLPMSHDPGEHYAYCSATMNLMSGALTRATGTWLPALFHRDVARPLQFGHYHFNLSPALEGYLGGGAYLRPRDLLKLGQLYLDGGVWNGRRIVPRSWVARSTAKQIEWPYRDENVSAGVDGYAWHLNTLRSGGREYQEYEANGNGGQLLIVVPELDLVVVFTAGNYAFGGVWSRFRSELVSNAIIPAVRR